jgi:hypothetical protein
MQARYAALAEEWGLAMTGGSDYHGAGRPGRELGSAALPAVAFGALVEKAAGSALRGAALTSTSVRARTL